RSKRDWSSDVCSPIYARTGHSTHLPAAVLAGVLLTVGLLTMTAGLALHGLGRRFRELDYLARSRLPGERGLKRGPQKSPSSSRRSEERRVGKGRRRGA